jgi:hypothetical protein
MSTGLLLIYEEYSIDSIPLWIRHSTVFKTFESDLIEYINDGNKLLLPKQCIFEYPNSINDNNIESMFQSVRFFEITDETILYDMFKYLMRNKNNETIINKLQDYFPEITNIWDNFNFYSDEVNILIRNNLFLRLRYSIEEMNLLCSEHSYIECIKQNNLDIFIYIHSKNFTWTNNVTSFALKNNKYEFFKYAHENGCEVIPISFREVNINGIDSEFSQYIIINNLLIDDEVNEDEEVNESEDDDEYEYPDSDSDSDN